MGSSLFPGGTIAKACRNRLQMPPPLHYPQAQDEHWDAQHDHPIFEQKGSNIGLSKHERGNLFHTP
jgi:hypothetical protein